MGGGDPTLIEKTIHAFALLCHLTKQGLPLVFKGGTSLMLRLPRPRRLSIDVDILCPLSAAELDAVLAKVGQETPFRRYEEDPRDPRRLPARRHFKFYYQPYDTRTPGPYVLLDVVTERSVYPHRSQVPIRSPLFLLEEEVSVEVPTVEGLLGDKLTAFAPNTVGVSCNADTAMQVMKQLFDVGELFDGAADFQAVAQAYDAIFRAENGYRGGRFTREGALTDTVETARRLCHHGFRGAPQHAHQPLLETGRKAVTSHLFGGEFSRDAARLAAAKAAFLATRLRDGIPQGLAPGFRYDSARVAQLSAVRLSDPVLQRLRAGNPEAFYYWSLVLEKSSKQ